MRIKLALILTLVLILPQLAAAQSSDRYSDKYKKLFYPKGMPVYKGKSPEYEFLAEYKVPDTNCIVVFYSENYEYEREEFSEEVGHEVEDYDIHRGVYVGVLERDGKKLKVLNKADMSDRVFDKYFDGCKDLGGYVKGINAFKAGKFFLFGIDVLFAGKGNVQYDSDFIFELDKNKSPRIVLNLGEVASFGQTRWDEYERSSTTIYTAEVDGVPAVLTRREGLEVDEPNQIYREMIQDGYSVYKYDEGEHVFKKSETIYKLPSGAKVFLTEEK